VHRSEDSHWWRPSCRYICDTHVYSSTLGAYSCYTKMLYDGGVTSFAQGWSPTPSGTLVIKGVTGSY
jgi:hypothetical protein